MINILCTMGGRSQFFDVAEYPFPKPLIEINGKSMIEFAVENYKTLSPDSRFVFVLRSEDCVKYHIDSVVKLLTDNKCKIVKIDKETAGAACSALMAIEHIDNDDKLLIVNSDQVIEEDMAAIVAHFDKRGVDAGVVCFESVHPRWSFVRLDEEKKIIEAAEKRPISRHAVAGVYYFRKGSFFVEAAMRSVTKGAHVNGVYYVAPVLNELVLMHKNLEMYKVPNEKYYTFYSPQKIAEYETVVSNRAAGKRAK